MSFHVKQFSFERYGGGGLDVIVRPTTSPTDPIYADVVLDGKKFAELLEYLGVNVSDEVIGAADIIAELESEVLALKDKIEDLTSEPVEDNNPEKPQPVTVADENKDWR